MIPAETLFKPLLRSPLETVVGGTNPWCDRTTVGSGVVTVTVSTSMVNSDSLIMMGVQVMSGGIINSAGAIVVNSVVPGVSFALTSPNAVGAPFTRTVMWMLVNPKG